MSPVRSVTYVSECSQLIQTVCRGSGFWVFFNLGPFGSDLVPDFRTEARMISDEGKGNRDVQGHEEAEMIGALKQVEAGRKVEDVARSW